MTAAPSKDPLLQPYLDEVVPWLRELTDAGHAHGVHDARRLRKDV